MEYNVSGTVNSLGMDISINATPTPSSILEDSTSFDILCADPSYLPSTEEYYADSWTVGLCLSITFASVSIIIIIASYIDTLRYIIRNSPPGSKTNAGVVISIYPVVGIATLSAILVPRSHFLAETIIHLMFMLCYYQFFCLIVSYCGGESEMLRRLKPESLNVRVGPCCCWPCFRCLPTNATISKKRLMFIRMLILQLPITQGIIYLILFATFTDDHEEFQSLYNYMPIFIASSIVIGIWGMIMTLRMTASLLEQHMIYAKFIVIQLVLLLTKFQFGFMKLAVGHGIFPCRYPFTPTYFGNQLFNVILMLEMVILCSLARVFYKKYIPVEGSVISSNLPKQISTIQDKIHNSDFQVNLGDQSLKY